MEIPSSFREYGIEVNLLSWIIHIKRKNAALDSVIETQSWNCGFEFLKFQLQYNVHDQ